MITPPHSVVVFGSLHYDIIVKGPHRPRKGETVAGSVWYPKFGGKGANQAVSAAKHGVNSVMIGAIGSDEFGNMLKDNLIKCGVDISWLRTIEGDNSGISVAIFDDEGDYGAVIVSGCNLSLCDEDVLAAKSVFRHGSILLLQNEVLDAANIYAAKTMKQAGGTVILNAAPARSVSPTLANFVDILVVNTVEAEALAEVENINSLNKALEAARLLVKQYSSVVVTAGGDGVAFANKNGEAAQVPAIKVKLVSTHGAGDEFIGVLAAELLHGATLEQAVNKGNISAARLVSSGVLSD